MAKPIEAIRPLKGHAARAMTEYLRTAKADPMKQQAIVRKDREAAQRVKTINKG